MRAGRPLLKTIMALGCVLSLAGATGVFAVFTDRATTGTNSLESEDLGRSADLQLAIGQQTSVIECGSFVDDLTTAVLSASDVAAGRDGRSEWMCVRNVGSSSVGVTLSVIDVTDADTDCTGDEAAEDSSCGEGDGELSARLSATITTMTCDGTDAAGSSTSFTSLATTPAALFTLGPDTTKCVKVGLLYTATDAQAVVSQSDTVTWRFAFDGTTAP